MESGDNPYHGGAVTDYSKWFVHKCPIITFMALLVNIICWHMVYKPFQITAILIWHCSRFMCWRFNGILLFPGFFCCYD